MFEIIWMENGKQISTMVRVPKHRIEEHIARLNARWFGKYHHWFRPTTRAVDVGYGPAKEATIKPAPRN